MFFFHIQFCEEVFAPFLILNPSFMIQILKLIFILHKDNWSKNKMQF